MKIQIGPGLKVTLKCTWMWSRRTSTRKNFRPQISQVYFLSPWVNRCLFILLLQENTCAHRHAVCVWRIQHLRTPLLHVYFQPCVRSVAGSAWDKPLPCRRWGRETVPSCTWSLPLRSPPALLSSSVLGLLTSITSWRRWGWLSFACVEHDIFALSSLQSSSV